MSDDTYATSLVIRLAIAMLDDDDDGYRDNLDSLGHVDPEPRKDVINRPVPGEAETLLAIAAREGRAEAVARLIDWGADVDALDDNDETPLANALWANRWKDTEEIVLALIDAGASCTGIDRFGLTPLHHAAATGSPAMIGAVITAGAEIDALDRLDGGVTPLHCAAEDGNGAAIPLLLDAGAAPGRTTANGESALLLAVMYGHRDAALALLGAGCDADGGDRKGRTPLHFAARNGDRDITADLIAAGADLYRADDLGQTPLQILTAFGDLDGLAAPDGVVVPMTPKPLATPERLAVFVALILQNSSGTVDYVESSFVAMLHEKNLWLVDRCKRLRDAVTGLASDRSRDSFMPRAIARLCHHIFDYVVVAAASHRSINDGFDITNLDDDAVDEEIGEFTIAFSRFFTGDHGVTETLSVDGLVTLEMEARRLS